MRVVKANLQHKVGIAVLEHMGNPVRAILPDVDEFIHQLAFIVRFRVQNSLFNNVRRELMPGHCMSNQRFALVEPADTHTSRPGRE
jgi:hypothetical protein